MTLKVRKDVPRLRSKRFVRELERTFSQACDQGSFRVVHYSVQNDHAHLLVEATDGRILGRGMKSIAARFARAVNRVFDRTGPVLADRYHLRVLRTPREVRNALAYVLLNHRRHAAKRGGALPRGSGRVDPASSGRWFDGWRRGVGLPAPAGLDRAVAVSRFWLLQAGWRRHGLLDPEEIPGRAEKTRRRAS